MKKIIIGAATGIACVGVVIAAKKITDRFIKKIGKSYPLAPFDEEDE